jgi:hypothetical protein
MVRSIVCLFMLVTLAACSDSQLPGLSFVNGPSLSCAEPAPLRGEPEIGHEDDYFVCFKDGVNVSEEAARLAAAYGFVPRYVYTIIPCMVVHDLSQEIVDGLRCEPTVDHLSYEWTVYPY